MGMQGMAPPPPGVPWPRGIAPGGMGGMGAQGSGMGAQGGMMGGSHMGPGGMMYGMQNGPMGGQMMRGGAAAGGGAGQSGRGGGGAAYEATYNVMPASQLELDARAYDKPLLEKSDAHLQLLQALMKVGDWDHAVLLLDWLQVGRGGWSWPIRTRDLF